MRYGRIMMVVTAAPRRSESFLVREEDDGSLLRFLGLGIARTSDGWVSLPEWFREEIAWDAVQSPAAALKVPTDTFRERD